MNETIVSQGLEYTNALNEFRAQTAPGRPKIDSDLVKSRLRLELARIAMGMKCHRVDQGNFIPAVSPDLVIGRTGHTIFATPIAEVTDDILKAQFEASCTEYWERVSTAQGLCGQFYQSVRTQQQLDAVESLGKAESRVHAIQDALKNGNFGPYVQMIESDCLRMPEESKAAAGLTGTATVEQDVSHDGRVEPTLAPVQSEAASFDQVSVVVELCRRLALEDYFRHVQAVVDANDEVSKTQAVQRLQLSEKAARLTDSTYQSLMAAQSEQRATTVALIRGDAPAAERANETSVQHLNVVAEKLDRFGNYAPTSTFFQATMNAVHKADELAGRIEGAVARKVEDFAKGLKGFARRVRALGDVVSRSPSVVRQMTVTAGISSAQAATTSYFNMKTRLGAMFGRAENKIQAVKASAEHMAWDLIDNSAALMDRALDVVDHAVDSTKQAAGNFAAGARAVTGQVVASTKSATNSLVDGARGVADAVDLHVRASAGLAGGIIGRVGAVVASGYAESLDDVRVKRSQTELAFDQHGKAEPIVPTAEAALAGERPLTLSELATQVRRPKPR